MTDMTASEARKEAIRKFKERKAPRGIFAIRCTVTGRVWVESSRNLDAAHNSSWFCLRNNLHLNKALQSDWNAHGESSFTFEVLETLDDDVHALELADLLKRKQAEWRSRLGTGAD